MFFFCFSKGGEERLIFPSNVVCPTIMQNKQTYFHNRAGQYYYPLQLKNSVFFCQNAAMVNIV